MAKNLDLDGLITYLESRGGVINGIRAGQVASKLANVLGVPPYSISQILRRLERKGVVRVDRGKGGRFIYGVKLLVNSATDLQIGGEEIVIPASATVNWPQDTYMATSTDGFKLRPAPPDLEDYSGLAAKLLEKAVDAIAENQRLKERIQYLEGKVQGQPQFHLTEQRHNVIKDLLGQVDPDV